MVINFLKLGWLIKLIKLVLFLSFVLTVVFGYFLIKDAIDFKNNFGNSTNTFILKDGTTFLSGIKLDPKLFGEDKFLMISPEKLNEMELLYSEKNISGMKKEDYKIIVFDLKTLDTMSETQISAEEMTNITKDEAKKILLSDNVNEDFAQLLSEKQNIPIAQARYSLSRTKSEDIKGYLFSSIIAYYFNPKNSKEFIKEIRNKNIEVYEETFLFKSIKLIPNFMANELLSEG